MNLADPKRIDLVRVVDSWIVESTGVDDPWLDEDDAGEIVSPARAVPTDGANCRNIVSADPSRDMLGFRDMETDALVISTADRGTRFTQVRGPRRGKTLTPACLILFRVILQWISATRVCSKE